MPTTHDPSAADVSNWANLPSDILACIANRLLSVADYIRFAAVCTAWSAVASPIPLSLRKVPYLLISGDVGEQSDSCALLSLSDNQLYRIASLPEIRGKWCLGSQYGWIVTLDEFSNPSLLNPLTRSQIHLPPITSISELEISYSPGSILTYDVYTLRGFFHCSCPDEFRKSAVRKIVLSSSPAHGDFTAMAIFSRLKILMYARSGDSKWTFLDDPLPGVIVSVPSPPTMADEIMYRDHKFFILFHVGDLYSVDLRDSSAAPTLVAKWSGMATFDDRYLVESSGELLQVCVQYTYKHFDVEVWRLDPEPATWIPVINLGDISLFLGFCCSMTFSVGDIPGFEKNCVYFPVYTGEKEDILHHEEGRSVICDVGVYRMRDSSVTFICPPDTSSLWPPPPWIVPSAC